MADQTIQDVLYLLDAWDRGAYAEEYPNEIEALRTALADQKLADAFAEDFPNTWGKKKHTAPPNKQEPVAKVNFTKPGYIHWLKLPPVGLNGDEFLYTAPSSKPEQEQGCAECGVKASEGYALYCVKCIELFTQPEQEPVAWMFEEYAESSKGYMKWFKCIATEKPQNISEIYRNTTPLFTAPPSKPEPAEYDASALYKAKAEREQTEKQEPVAYLCENAVGHKYFRWKKPTSHYKPIALYTAPPKAWVSLTDDDRIEIFNSMDGGIYGFLKTWGWLNFSKALEAKLKELNHG